MNYSRRQLVALGETLGECVTRKEGGRLIYGGGGSGSAPPASQTAISDLPEWAKPYAKETLGKAQALTDINQNPYQTYGGERIAGFTPMQQQAQAAAGQMQPSQLGAQAGQMAGAATLGALGTSYDPYQTGQFTSGAAQQYMSPYLEAAMAPQLREAQRASEMQGIADQAQATRAGAFGGSRQAIVEAERQRNLGMQQGDIRARGYQSAFDQAQQQFAREQQLREQSRQYGAGLGLQGLQTALQGAGQMGALGGQQFGQAMDINRLQQQVGSQQQALEQQRLGQNYQDFMNQQRYPYQQLEFMSNILRGTPMGTVQTMYQPPSSTLGQLAGLGIGLGGMAQFGRMFNEGGQVDGYADGGSVTSDYKVDEILNNLSDTQLQQARMAALNSRDMRRVEAIDEELAERASLRSGLGGAFNSLPEDTQEAVTEMATGGIVAFDEGGRVERYSDGGTMAGFFSSPEDMALDELRVQNELRRRAEEDRYGAIVEGREPTPAPQRAQPAPQAAPQPAPQAAPKAAPETAAPRAQRRPAVTAQSASEAVKTISEAARVQIPKDETRELTKSLLDELMKRPNAQQEEFKKELESAKNRAKEIEARGIGEAMMKFGFTMAAAAAKPGAGSGLSGALKSAAAASPAFAESMAENAKLKQAAEDNYMKLRMENARYQTAVEQGNMQLAATLANNISQRKLTQASLEQQINQQDRMFELEKEKVGIMRSTRADSSQPALVRIAERYLKEDPNLSFEQAMDKASRVAGYSFRSEQAGDLKRAELLSKFRKENPMYGMLVMQRDRAKTPEERAVFQQKIDVLESEALGKLAAPSAAGVGSGQAYPGFRLVQ